MIFVVSEELPSEFKHSKNLKNIIKSSLLLSNLEINYSLKGELAKMKVILQLQI